MTVLTMPRSLSGSAGEVAGYIEKEKDLGYNSLQASDTLGLTAKGIFRRLVEIFQECSTPGWDGENAQPVSIETLRYSRVFIESLPLGIELPNVSAEPDGAITLEWYRNPHQVISVSIDSDGWFHYAALRGTTKRHGADSVQMDISEDVLQLINYVIQD